MWKKYTANTDGNFSTIFALVMVPLLITVGVSIDLTRTTKMQRNLQDAADSAALAGAIAYMQGGQKDMKRDATTRFKSNAALSDQVKLKDLKVRKNGDKVYLEASAKVTPKFVQLFGYPRLDIKVGSTASLGQDIGAEVVIAIDTTNSMAFGSQWNDMLVTVENMVDDMQSLTGDKNFFLTLIPFQDRVNVGSVSKSWLKTTGSYDWGQWSGCVEPRESGKGKSKWMLDDKSPTSQKFTPSKIGDTYSDGRTIKCPDTPITGPTNNINEVVEALKTLKSSGTGRQDVGLAWAWRAVSPNWRGKWGVPNYPSKLTNGSGKSNSSNKEKARKKYIVYVTDGRTNAFKLEAMQEESWGWNNGSKEAFENIAELCADIKKDNVEIYMLQIPGNPNATPYFKSCATSSSHYFTVNSPKDIPIAFNGIRESLYASVRTLD